DTIRKTKSDCVKTEDEKKKKQEEKCKCICITLIEKERLKICRKLVLELMVQVQLLRIPVDQLSKLHTVHQPNSHTRNNKPDAAIAFPTIPWL
ncbi:hypothetical protein MKW92_004239, partial [Papaver armeniacum]